MNPATVNPEYILDVHDEIRRILATKAESSLATCVRHAWHAVETGSKFQSNWHIGCVSEHLQAQTEGQLRNLIINLPPRHTKSIIACAVWPAWEWISRPQTKWIFSSYGESLSNRDADAARRIIRSRWYQSNWKDRFAIDVPGYKSSVDYYENNKGGLRISTTIEGKGTGHGCDRIVCDDPIKPLDARSKTELDKVIEWWTKTMPTRGNDPRTFTRTVIMQRLHERDLTGYLMAESDSYEHLVLPAMYEPKRMYEFRPKPMRKDAIVKTSVQHKKPETCDPRKEEGELIWPERFGPKEVDSLKNDLKDGWPGQLQQRPAPASGLLFQASHFRYSRLVSTSTGQKVILNTRGEYQAEYKLSECRLFQVADTASKVKKKNDHTAIGTFLMTPGFDLVIFHMMQFKIEIPFQMKMIKLARSGPIRWMKEEKKFIVTGVWPKRLIGQWVEDASSGVAMLQTALTQGVALRTLKGTQDPIERASVLSAMYENGQVYHLEGGKWVTDFEDEVINFPNASHDDRETTAAYAAQLVTTSNVLRLGLSGLDDVAASYTEKEIDAETGLPNYHRQAYRVEDGETYDENSTDDLPIEIDLLGDNSEIIESHDRNIAEEPEPSDYLIGRSVPALDPKDVIDPEEVTVEYINEDDGFGGLLKLD